MNRQKVEPEVVMFAKSPEVAVQSSPEDGFFNRRDLLKVVR